MSDIKFVVMCNTIIIALFCYAVFILNASGWWFLLMVLLFDSITTKTTGSKNE